MMNRKSILALTAGLAIVSIGSWNLLSAQQGVPSQPGTPSKPAKPSNPTPPPSNPIPDPNNPQPRPADPIPNTDPKQPDKPTNPQVQPPTSPTQPDQPVQPVDPNRPVVPVVPSNRSDRVLRPFAFQTPQVEGSFNQSTHRLLNMEQKMLRSQEDLLKRLGEVRQLSGERQMNALFDLVQQMLKEHGEMAQYLVQARTVWTGDIETAAPAGTPVERRDGVITRPATTPSGERNK